ncbi:MAG: AzlD domain-containing protein [Mycobacteriales bacterium]
MSWLPIAAVVIGCFALKLAGTSLPPRILDEPRVAAMAALVPIALFGAVIAIQTIGGDRAYAVDARLAGLAVAVLAVLLKAPFVLVVVAAAATTALIRAVS